MGLFSANLLQYFFSYSKKISVKTLLHKNTVKYRETNLIKKKKVILKFCHTAQRYLELFGREAVTSKLEWI